MQAVYALLSAGLARGGSRASSADTYGDTDGEQEEKEEQEHETSARHKQDLGTVPSGLRVPSVLGRHRKAAVCGFHTVEGAVRMRVWRCINSTVMSRPTHPRIASTGLLCSSAVPSSSMPQRPAVHRCTVGFIMVVVWDAGLASTYSRARALPCTRKKNTQATSSAARMGVDIADKEVLVRIGVQ